MSSNSFPEELAVAAPWIMGVCFVVLAQQVIAIRRLDDRVDVSRASATPRRTARMTRIGPPPSTMTAGKTASATAPDRASALSHPRG